jgi:hypothetical protein
MSTGHRVSGDRAQSECRRARSECAAAGSLDLEEFCVLVQRYDHTIDPDGVQMTFEMVLLHAQYYYPYKHAVVPPLQTCSSSSTVAHAQCCSVIIVSARCILIAWGLRQVGDCLQ